MKELAALLALILPPGDAQSLEERCKWEEGKPRYEYNACRESNGESKGSPSDGKESQGTE